MQSFTARVRRSFSLLKTKVLDDEAYHCNSVYVFSRWWNFPPWRPCTQIHSRFQVPQSTSPSVQSLLHLVSDKPRNRNCGNDMKRLQSYSGITWCQCMPMCHLWLRRSCSLHFFHQCMEVKRGDRTERLRNTMTLRHLLMHTSGIGYGPGAIIPGVRLIARSPEEKLLTKSKADDYDR